MFKFGIVGTGIISAKFANCLKVIPDTEIVAVCDLNKASAEKFAAERGVAKVYDNVADLAKDEEIDAVYIATTNPSHYPIAKECLENGRNVYMEKPFVMNGDEARDLVRIAKEKNLFLCENLWTKYLPIYDKVRKLLADGEIGEVRFIHCDYFFPADYDPNNRLFDPKKGGGALLDIGTYGVSFIGMFFGYEPDKVVSLAGICPTGVEDRIHVGLKYGNKIATINCSVTTPAPQKATIIGTKGRMEIPEFGRAQHGHVWVYGDGRTDANSKGAGTRSSVPEGGHDYEIDCPFEENGFEYVVRAVVDAIKTGKKELPKITLDETIAWAQIKADILKENL